MQSIHQQYAIYLEAQRRQTKLAPQLIGLRACDIDVLATPPIWPRTILAMAQQLGGRGVTFFD